MGHKIIYLNDGGLWAVLLRSDEDFDELEKSGVKLKWHDLWIEGEHNTCARLLFEDGSQFDVDFQKFSIGVPVLLTNEKSVHHIMPAEAKRKRERVVFLDLDGVLNTAAELFDAKCVENLRTFLTRTGAKIVISSSWRIYGEDYVQSIWRKKNLPGEIIGVTPLVSLPPDNLTRGHEIKEWIDSHDVTNYVIIDDDNEMLPEQQSHLVLTDGMTGLSEEDVIKAIKIMNKTEIYKEKKWKSRARIHQSDYREKVLKCDCGPNPSRDGVMHFYGNILEAKAAKEGKNFVGFYREIIRQDICGRGGIKGEGFPNNPLTNNMLRSEHIAYNLFFPMRQNLAKLAELLRKITSLEIREVQDLKVEHPVFPREVPNPWTGDHTAFDVYVQYIDNEGETCAVGIEIKYTEEGYAIGDGEKERLGDKTSEYHAVTMASGCFVGCETLESTHERLNDKKGILHDRFRQMWRNHILGLGMTQKEVEGYPRLHKFLSLHIYPAWNEHFAGEKGAVKGYAELLSEKGRETFRAITYEELFEAMKDIVFDPANDAVWKKYLKERYLILD